jgi:hypothetical protein
MLPGIPQAGSLLPEAIGFGEVQNASSYECLVTGKLESGGFLRLLTLLESTGVRIQTSYFQANQPAGTFSSTILIQTAKSDVEMFAMVEKVMQSRLVKSIEFSPRNKRIFSNYRFPITIGKNERVVLIRAEVIFDLEIQFREMFGEKSDSLFYDAGRSYGEDLTRLSPKRSEFESDTEYLEALLDVTKATGWGVGAATQLENSEMLFFLSEPPSNRRKTTSSFLLGMLTGIAEVASGSKLKVGATSFDTSKNILTLRIVLDSEK